MAELRADGLRFSPPECAAFLRRRLGDDALSDSQVALLHKQTEGWPVGLRLAALSLRHHPDRAAFLRDFAGTNRYVLEYLTEEVLRHQPETIRAFLLRTAPLQQLTAPLCDALRGAADSAALLEYLEENNLFLVPLDERGEWYRYHHLFAELLRGMLRRQWPDEIPALHRRAARWYAEHDRPEAAIDHALAAGDDAYAARLLDDHAPRAILRGESRAVARWLEQLSPARRRMAPRATMAYGWTLLLHGDYAGVAAQIARLEQSVPEDNDSLQGELAALRAGLASVRGQARIALAYAQEAIARAPAENRLVQAHAHFALAGAYRTLGNQAAAIGAYEQALPLCHAAGMRLPEMLSRSHLAHLYRLRGQLSRAEAICRPVLDEKLEHPAMGGVFSNLGAVSLERAEVARAEQLLQRGLQLSSRGEHPASLVFPRAVLARLHLARGDTGSAGAALSAAAAHLADGVPAWVVPEVVEQQVAFWLAQGDVTLAEQALDGVEPAGDHLAEKRDLARVRILLHRRDWRAADALLIAVEHSARKGGRTGRLLTTHILRAQLRYAQGDESGAGNAVRQALTLAEPEEYVLRFVEGGEAVARLLAGVATPFARRVLEAFPVAVRETAVGAVTPIEPLTGRELEVLRLMADGHTYRQIADRLVISVNTVRTHVKNIYGKLDVNKRTLALARARELHLLDE
jgi:LuxR family maltose regulon positive regulatory protein